ncbi:MAG: prolyl oligopeptidase family serine peptidase [Cyclobacteriaceae bacterium]|nr:prolyl oligopeptidase family serine peptidase [Cyclobacteriaceae bacterium]
MKIIKRENIVLKGKHDKPIVIDYRYSQTESKTPLVLFIHGFQGFKDWSYFNLMSDYYVKNGFTFVKMNFSHNGTTPEHPTEFVDLEAFGNNNFTKELDDIETVLDFLCSEKFELYDKVDFNSLFIKGHSRGAGVALLKANEDARIKGAIALASINNIRDISPKEPVEQWEKDGVLFFYNPSTDQNMPMYYQLEADILNNENRFNIANAVKRLNKPLLIIHGTDDELFPVSMAYDMHTWKPDAQLVIIEGANHVFGGVNPYISDEMPKHALQAINDSIEFLRS